MELVGIMFSCHNTFHVITQRLKVCHLKDKDVSNSLPS
jgi:hypothetical protein